MFILAFGRTPVPHSPSGWRMRAAIHADLGRQEQRDDAGGRGDGDEIGDCWRAKSDDSTLQAPTSSTAASSTDERAAGARWRATTAVSDGGHARRPRHENLNFARIGPPPKVRRLIAESRAADSRPSWEYV